MIGDRLNLSARPNWRERAACRGKPTEWFFPAEQGYNWQPPREALELCAACPVQAECAKAGAREYGVWGGIFHAERGSRRIRAEKAPEPVGLTRVRARKHRCDGCGRGFLNVQGLRSHQAYKRCGRAYPKLTLAQEVAVFEASIVVLEDDLEGLG